MIEFRWLVQRYEDTFGHAGMSQPVLQYRVKYDTQVTAGLGPHTPSGNWAWSKWSSIPTVISEDVMYV